MRVGRLTTIALIRRRVRVLDTHTVLAAVVVAVGLLVIVAGSVVGRVVTIAHEGGHMAIGILTGGRVKDFQLNADEEGGGTNYHRLPGWLGDILTTFAGYVTPPLLGLGGAVLLKEGVCVAAAVDGGRSARPCMD